MTQLNHKNEKTTCSCSCSNKYFQHGQNNDDFDKNKYEKRYEKVSASLKRNAKPRKIKHCLQCNIDITSKSNKSIFCSNVCRSLYPISSETRLKMSLSIKERIKNGLHKGWTTRNIESYPEQFFKKVLDNNNIKYEFNKTISKKSLGVLNDISNYFLDFYIENVNMDLEIDGKQHELVDRVEHDKIRDSRLSSNNYNVYRIKWKNINTESGRIYIEGEINKFLIYYNLLLKK